MGGASSTFSVSIHKELSFSFSSSCVGTDNLENRKKTTLLKQTIARQSSSNLSIKGLISIDRHKATLLLVIPRRI